MPETGPELKQNCVENDTLVPKKVSRRSMLMALGIGINAVPQLFLPYLSSAISLLQRGARKCLLIWLGFPWASLLNPRRRDTVGDLSQSTRSTLGWRHGEYPCLVRRISSDKFQVFAITAPISAAPCDGSTIGTLHVSVPWWRLLC